MFFLCYSADMPQVYPTAQAEENCIAAGECGFKRYTKNGKLKPQCPLIERVRSAANPKAEAAYQKSLGPDGCQSLCRRTASGM